MFLFPCVEYLKSSTGNKDLVVSKRAGHLYYCQQVYHLDLETK